jgi:hypothetical protein
MAMTVVGSESMAPHPFPLKAGAKFKLRRNHGSGTSGSGGILPEMPPPHYPNNYNVELPPNPGKGANVF